MKSTAVVFACLLLFVSVAVIASAVSEGNQEQPDKVEAAKETPVEESKQRCYHGCCRYHGYRCVKCCGSVAEAQANTNTNNNNDVQQEREVEEATPHRWGGGGGHGGWRGGGGHGGYGGGGGGHGGWRGGGGHGGWGGGGGHGGGGK